MSNGDTGGSATKTAAIVVAVILALIGAGVVVDVTTDDNGGKHIRIHREFKVIATPGPDFKQPVVADTNNQEQPDEQAEAKKSRADLTGNPDIHEDARDETPPGVSLKQIDAGAKKTEEAAARRHHAALHRLVAGLDAGDHPPIRHAELRCLEQQDHRAFGLVPDARAQLAQGLGAADGQQRVLLHRDRHKRPHAPAVARRTDHQERHPGRARAGPPEVHRLAAEARGPGRLCVRSRDHRPRPRGVRQHALGCGQELPLGRVHQAGPGVELPRDKAAAQKILLRFNFKGLKIESIEPPRDLGGGHATARIYALTQPRLTVDNAMKRKAVTVVFYYDGTDVTADKLEGWVV
jgi:hypothetical protein